MGKVKGERGGGGGDSHFRLLGSKERWVVFWQERQCPSPKVNEALPTGTIEVVWDVIFSRYLIGHLTGMYKH